MDKIAILYDSLGYIIGRIIVLLGLVAFVRVMKKKKKGESVHIEPVGVFQDLQGQ